MRSLRIMDEHRIVLPVRNSGTLPLTVVIEPWGLSQTLAPGAEVFVVARGPRTGNLDIQRSETEVVVYGWEGSQVAFSATDPAERSLADFFVEQMRTPPDASAQAKQDAFEAEKAAALHAWMVQRREKLATAPTRAEKERTGEVAGSGHEVMSAAYERVLAAPSSLAAREALAAEWKAKQDPRAELIDKQLRLRRHRLDDTLWCDEANALNREIRVLLKKHGAQWAGDAARMANDVAFHRGCVAEVTLPGAAFVSAMPQLLAVAPIQHVNLTAPLALEQVAESPHLARLSSLRICELRAGFGDAQASTLARSPHIANLVWLSLTDNAIGKAGAEALAASPQLARCAFVDLAGTPYNPTPFVTAYEGVENRGRPGSADELERAFGKRTWLQVPAEGSSWPPHRDDVATTP
jgi:hypothetical protein